MSPYATNQLAALSAKPNRTPYEETVLLELTERDAAERNGEIAPMRKYILGIGGAPATEAELACVSGLPGRFQAPAVTRPADEFDETDWEIHACHAHAF